MEEQRGMNVSVDTLKYIFLKMREVTVSEGEALKNNLTEVFIKWLREKILAGELIVINVNGEVRTGKSTTQIELVRLINRIIYELNINKTSYLQMWKYIFSDQTEFLRFIDRDERNLCIGIDEFNSLANTGLNASTEESLFDYYSDVFAGQYVHRVTTGTDSMVDKNTTVMLEVIGKNKEEKITTCKLIYRDIVSRQRMVLGRVDIYVGDLIKNWVGVAQNIVERGQDATKEEKEVLNKLKKEDLYVKYQVRKYRRMDLLKKEGVRDLRELEFADIILESVLELEELSRLRKCTRELILTIVDEVIRRHKRFYSMFAKQEITSKVSAILALNTEINKSLKAKKSKNITGEQIRIIDMNAEKLKTILAERFKEQEHLRDLYRVYLSMEA